MLTVPAVLTLPQGKMQVVANGGKLPIHIRKCLCLPLEPCQFFLHADARLSEGRYQGQAVWKSFHRFYKLRSVLKELVRERWPITQILRLIRTGRRAVRNRIVRGSGAEQDKQHRYILQ